MSTQQNVILQTVSGVNPEMDTPLEYKIHTGMAEKFVRERFKQVTDSLIRTKQPYAKINYDEDIHLKSVMYSEKFVPMILTMPGTVIDRTLYNPKISSMFQNTEETSVPIMGTYWNLILPWIYKPAEIKELREGSMLQRSLGLDRRAVHEMVYFSTIRIKDLDGEDYSNDAAFIILSADRVFMDMLRDRNNPKQRISVRMINVKPTGQDTALYKMTRLVTRRNKQRNNRDIAKVSAILRNTIDF